MSRGATLAALFLLVGCSASLGPVGVLAVDPNAIGSKLLRPGLEGRSCRSNVLGVPLRAGLPEVGEALAQILAQDPDGNVVTHAEIRARTLVTVVYNRSCIEVRGDLAQATSRLTLPAQGHEHH
jgi:hypothetical protein